MAGDPSLPRIAGVVLAGGRSARMGRPKATLPWGDGTFVAAVLRTLSNAGASPLLVVCGAHATETARALPAELDVSLVSNPAPARGQLSSLQVALRALGDVDGAIVSLVDHPAVRAETVSALLDAVRPDRIVVPRHQGRRGHPVVFGSELFAELCATPHEAGARAVVRADPARVLELDVDDAGIHVDIDTPDDLAAATRDRA